MSTPYTPSNGGSRIITPGRGGDSFSTASDVSRVLPRQLSTGSLRGTQNVGYGSVKIDGSNNRITIGQTSSGLTMYLGQADNGAFGVSINGAGNASSNMFFGVSASGDPDIKISGSSGSSIDLGVTNNSARLIFNDSVVNRLLVGKNSTGDEVIWISANGVDVLTANPNVPGQLIFNSNQDIFRIVRTGTLTIPSLSITSSGASRFETSQGPDITFAHGLGYTPAVVGYELNNSATDYLALPYTQFFSTPNFAGGQASVRIAADNTVVSASVQLMAMSTPTNGLTVTYTGATVKYYLLQQSLNS